MFGNSVLLGYTIRKVKHSSVIIGNPLSALYRTEYFSFARTFRTAWEDGSADFLGCKLLIFSRLTILESADPFKFKGVGGWCFCNILIINILQN